MINLNLFFEDIRWSFSFPIKKIEEAILNTINLDRKGNISIVFTNDEYVRSLNKNYRGKDSTTNVLSFPYDDSQDQIGDIFLSFETILKESGFDKLEQHTVHLIIHGILHVFGYDHIEESEALIMENLESKIMIKMGLLDPWNN